MRSGTYLSSFTMRAKEIDKRPGMHTCQINHEIPRKIKSIGTKEMIIAAHVCLTYLIEFGALEDSFLASLAI